MIHECIPTEYDFLGLRGRMISQRGVIVTGGLLRERAITGGGLGKCGRRLWVNGGRGVMTAAGVCAEQVLSLWRRH